MSKIYFAMWSIRQWPTDESIVHPYSFSIFDDIQFIDLQLLLREHSFGSFGRANLQDQWFSQRVFQVAIENGIGTHDLSRIFLKGL